jgi:hypothetical protein
MNLIENIQDRINENKASVKTYKTYETACKTADDLALTFAQHHGKTQPVEYIPVYLPNLERWTVVFRQMKWLQRHSVGGYLGHFANKGFFSI